MVICCVFAGCSRKKRRLNVELCREFLLIANDTAELTKSKIKLIGLKLWSSLNISSHQMLISKS